MPTKNSNVDGARERYEKLAAEVPSTMEGTPERHKAMQAKLEAFNAFRDAERAERDEQQKRRADAAAGAEKAGREAAAKAAENDPPVVQTEPNFGLTSAPTVPSPANAAFEARGLRGIPDEELRKAERFSKNANKAEGQGQERKDAASAAAVAPRAARPQ